MIIQALHKVFRSPYYVVLALFISASAFALAAWLPNIRLVAGVVVSSDISLSDKVKLPISLLGSISTNFTSLSAVYTVAIVILFGVYVPMMVYFLRRRVRDARQGGAVTGILGLASGVLGVGCAACGSFILGTLLSFIGASGVIAFLPLGGEEFGILGALLLAIAIYMTARRIEAPIVCPIEIKS